MNTTFKWERDEDTRVLMDLEFTMTPYDPGNNYGPPENCYPPEGGEIESLEAEVSELFMKMTDGLWELIDVSDDLARTLKQEFMKLYNEDSSFQDRVDGQCAEAGIESYYSGDCE